MPGRLRSGCGHTHQCLSPVALKAKSRQTLGQEEPLVTKLALARTGEEAVSKVAASMDPMLRRLRLEGRRAP